MICETCFCMLRGQVGRQLMGSFDLQFDHQRSEGSLKQAADTGCCVCRRLWEDLTRSEYRAIGRARGQAKRNVFLYAYLRKLKKLQWENNLYLLSFRLSSGPRLSSFVLEPLLDSKPEQSRYSPTSQSLDSSEVLKLAKFWLRTCVRDHKNCQVGDFASSMRTQQDDTGASDENFYPTRLIELNPPGAVKELELANLDPETQKPKLRLASTLRRMEEVEPRSVRLLVTKSAEHMKNRDRELDRPEGRYVTLSHCWGRGRKIISLQSDNLLQYRQGIPTRELPRTFRQAIRFARRLDPEVKYIWIDSLCIMQDNNDDWKHEAAQMYQVYRNSYCNISATAAMDSSEGLYAERDPRTLWETEINVNGDAEIPGMRTLEDGRLPCANVSRCTIIDPNFWSSKVDDAPINRRGWVLQERLLAPRVIHFCDDQIAWECCDLDAAESAPLGISDIDQRRGFIQKRIRLKDQTAAGAISGDVAHENWKRIVERYSRTSLTFAKDKLIALAGIAELMSHHISGSYVAGMWETYLASQLLWRVETVYRHNKFEYPSRRPKDPRAPSFSWAAVDAPQGIKCCETVKEDQLLFKVAAVDVEPPVPLYRGHVKENASISLECQLLRVRIKKKPRIVQDDSIFTMLLADPQMRNRETHADVYLDSPVDDMDHLGDARSSVYMMPGYKNAKGYQISLLLREIRTDVFARVGVSVNSPYVGEKSSSFLLETGKLRGWGAGPIQITVV